MATNINKLSENPGNKIERTWAHTALLQTPIVRSDTIIINLRCGVSHADVWKWITVVKAAECSWDLYTRAPAVHFCFIAECHGVLFAPFAVFCRKARSGADMPSEKTGGKARQRAIVFKCIQYTVLYIYIYVFLFCRFIVSWVSHIHIPIYSSQILPDSSCTNVLTGATGTTEVTTIVGFETRDPSTKHPWQSRTQPTYRN